MLGRFLSPDPIVPEPGNPQALNRYSYVLNNRVGYIDPSDYACVEGDYRGHSAPAPLTIGRAGSGGGRRTIGEQRRIQRCEAAATVAP